MHQLEIDGKLVDVAWEAIPGSSQELALDTRCDHTLYHGTRGPGKTITQLMRFKRHVGVGYGSYWRGIIFDCEFKNLADLVAQSKRFFGDFGDGAKFHKSASDYKWVWPTGEELLFRHIKTIDDYDNFHGHEYPFIGWNELTKYATGELYWKMMSTNRSSFVAEVHTPQHRRTDPKQPIRYKTPDGLPLPAIPLEVFSTTNPSGVGHNWVKDQFITCANFGVVVRTEVEVFDPRTQKDVIVVKKQVSIFGSYRENIYLSPDYIATLNNLTEHNENLRKAWLEGSWDVTAGGALDDLWSRDIHIIPRFVVPSTWYVDRAFDWGSTHPFSVGWWAEANGEEAKLPDGTTFCPPAGSLIQITEWYGCEKIGTNRGLRMSAPDIADGIKKIETEMLAGKWISSKPRPGPADNQIYDVRESDVDTIALKMELRGIMWVRSDKSPGSRINGLALFRDRLGSAKHRYNGIDTGKLPEIYFCDNCIGSIKTLPCLPTDPKKIEDVDTKAEDHIYDMVRYRVLAGSNRFATSINVTFPT